MNILIVYGTTEGQTRKVAEFMEGVLNESGHIITVVNALDNPPTPIVFDTILIGGSIHMHKYQTALVHYIRHYAAELNQKPTAFFSVCLGVASDLEEEHHTAEQTTQDLLSQTGWKPLMSTQIAGALKFTEYDFFKRLIMKMISNRKGGKIDTSKDYEYTDWNAVKTFVNEFVLKASSL